MISACSSQFAAAWPTLTKDTDDCFDQEDAGLALDPAGGLMLLFLKTGGSKLAMPVEQMAGPITLPLWFMCGIGVAEVLGGLGTVQASFT
jgi:hypothetical protein